MSNLAVLFGDQLRRNYLDDLGLDPSRDRVLMIEASDESTAVPSHVQRTVMFLSAMRHFSQELKDAGWSVDYVRLDDKANTGSFATEIARALKRRKPEQLRFIRPGEWRVMHAVESACREADVECTMHEDQHFLTTPDDFAAWAKGRKELTMEYFYREQRRTLDVLVDSGGKPTGGAWNFDKENRKAFKTTPRPPARPAHEPDDTTRSVMGMVARELPDLPGVVDDFNWPVTRLSALAALRDFIEHRLPRFGDYQDAMWTGEHTLYHAVISPSINLKLLDPREVYRAALDAYEAGHAPLNAVEGFIRQIIGWREFIRGIYWTQGDRYGERNGLRQYGSLPEFYWTADTDMTCMHHAIESVRTLSYGHHIARLMITGNFAMIAGIEPRRISDWYLGMYADGVDWVTLPNTLGMAMHADGGIVGTKPYAASGKYVNRMSNYCEHCRYDVNKRSGDDACPFNVFYWDFLIRNHAAFKKNHRMGMSLKNVDRLKDDERTQITVSARALRKEFGIGAISKP